VQHREMQRAFLSWIDRHPDDGRFILNNGYDWTYFEVEDVPFRVTAVRRTEQGLELRLDDDTEELLSGPAWTGPSGAIYLVVKGGRFEARLERDAQAGLSDALVETPDGIAFWSPGAPIPILDARPPRSPEGPILPEFGPSHGLATRNRFG
jgi:uncharacterized protein